MWNIHDYGYQHTLNECNFLYFLFSDAKELARQSSHIALREAVAAADVATIKSLFAELGCETELIINMAPSGSNTLLFM